MQTTIIPLVACSSIALISIWALKMSRSYRLEALIALLMNIKREIQRDTDNIVFLDTEDTPVYIKFSMSKDILETFDYLQEVLKGFQYEVHNFDFDQQNEEITFVALFENHQKKGIKFLLTYSFCKRKENGENKYKLSAR